MLPDERAYSRAPFSLGVISSRDMQQQGLVCAAAVRPTVRCLDSHSVLHTSLDSSVALVLLLRLIPKKETDCS